MILTGDSIFAMLKEKRIVIEPFCESYLEPNSYAFHLGEKLLEYSEEVVDARQTSATREVLIPEEGLILEPGRFYLGHTLERIGGVTFTSELFANRSISTLGIWVQTSAPLGHVGSVIRWTLEICVAQSIRVYAGMRMGKICFWGNLGRISPYEGRYVKSTSVVASKSFLDEEK